MIQYIQHIMNHLSKCHYSSNRTYSWMSITMMSMWMNPTFLSGYVILIHAIIPHYGINSILHEKRLENLQKRMINIIGCIYMCISVWDQPCIFLWSILLKNEKSDFIYNIWLFRQNIYNIDTIYMIFLLWQKNQLKN